MREDGGMLSEICGLDRWCFIIMGKYFHRKRGLRGFILLLEEHGCCIVVYVLGDLCGVARGNRRVRVEYSYIREIDRRTYSPRGMVQWK